MARRACDMVRLAVICVWCSVQKFRVGVHASLRTFIQLTNPVEATGTSTFFGLGRMVSHWVKIIQGPALNFGSTLSLNAQI